MVLLESKSCVIFSKDWYLKYYFLPRVLEQRQQRVTYSFDKNNKKIARHGGFDWILRKNGLKFEWFVGADPTNPKVYK